MRVLIPTVDFPPIEGGISTVALEVARALARQGHAVTVVAPRFPEMEDFDAAEPYTVLRFPGYDLGWFRLLPFLLACVGPARRTDLILAINVAYGGVLGRLARLVLRKPYLNFAYGYEFLKFARNPVVRITLRNIYAAADCTIAISRFTQEQLIAFGVAEDRIRVVLPGANIPEMLPPKAVAAARHQLDLEDAPYILAVGRFIPRKGHITLVEALALLQERGVHAQAVLVGRGPEREACQRKAAALGIEGSVRCPGYLPDETLRALYQGCACFALPTGEDEQGQVEGFGLVFTEAHAFGKPVVAGRSGGVTDAVLDGETGLLVSPGNPVELARALQRILEDPERAESLGRAGKKRVEDQLNWDAFAGALLETAKGLKDLKDDDDPRDPHDPPGPP